jgi:quinol monooxygenase YgiN
LFWKSSPLNKEHALFLYQIKLDIKENKIDEFITCLSSLSGEFRKEKGCLDFSLYRNIERENTFRVIGQWSTRRAMDNHFKKKHFSVLVGAARTLSETFEMNIGEAPETGGFELVREKITLHTEGSAASE